MAASAAIVEQLVAAQLARITQPELVTRIKELLVPVRCELVGWDYGEPEEVVPCWVVAYDSQANLAFAYTEHGFGPSYPWGMFRLGPDQSMGQDNCWYLTLEDVVRESVSWEGENPPEHEVG